MAKVALAGEVEAAERALSLARGELEDARELVVEVAGIGNDAEIEKALERRDQATWKLETAEARLEGLQARQSVLEAEGRREADRARAERLAGWRDTYVEQSAACDRLMVELATALEARAAAMRELQACSPKELNDLGRLLLPTELTRCALHHGLGDHLELRTYWQPHHRGRLQDDLPPTVDAEIRRLRADQERVAS